MIEIVPVREKKENTKTIFYLDDSCGNSMAKKYNWAIENIVLKNDDPIVCFRHDDLEFLNNSNLLANDILKYQYEHDKKIGVAGVIGTMNLERSMAWWNPLRQVNGIGSIIQCNKNEKGEDIEYPMNDWKTMNDHVVSMDGCCLFFHKRLFEDGLRFDENLEGYHFYDVDICLESLRRGYKNLIIPIDTRHKSIGMPPPNFNDLRIKVFNKWNEIVKGIFPITWFSFGRELENGRY